MGMPKQRRERGEVRRLLLAAAQASFATRGYSGTTTRDIAESAGVSEALIFRHFESKRKLFEEAILDPFNEFVAEYVEAWRAQLGSPLPTSALIRQFVEGLYQLLREHRGLIMVLAAADAFERETLVDGNGDSELSRHLDVVADVLGAEAVPRGLFGLDVPVTVRTIVSMVIGMTVLEEWLLPTGSEAVAPQLLMDEMVDQALYGLAGRRL
jgi:AcrR family transcriptional regulator